MSDTWQASQWRRLYGKVLRAEVRLAATSYGPQYRWALYPAHTEAELSFGFANQLDDAKLAVDKWVADLSDAALSHSVARLAAGQEGGTDGN